MPDDHSSPALFAELQALAEAAARAGGDIAREAFGRRQSVQTKQDGSEVTQTDLAAQAAVIQAIHARRPHDAIIGEESLQSSAAKYPSIATAQVCWIIDPIDGTRNFIRGLPLYACSVGACFAGRPVAGSIFAPQLGECYSAHEGGGLFLNGQMARPADREGLVKTPVVAVPSNVIGPAREILVHTLDRVVLRSIGSTALHLAWVAAGAYEASLNSDCKLWDIAAGYVLVRAAGGVCVSFDGGSLFPRDLAAYRGENTPCVAARDESILELLMTSP